MTVKPWTTTYLKICDFATQYKGYYTDNNSTIVLTRISGSGKPYWYLTGFNSDLVGKTVTVTCDNKNFGFTSREFRIEYMTNGDGYFKDCQGNYSEYPAIGMMLDTGEKANGTYNFQIIYNHSTFKLKIIIDI